MRKQLFRGSSTLSELEPDSERVLRDLTESLGSRLPAGWSVEIIAEPRARPGPTTHRPDAELILRTPDGTRGRVLIEARRRLDPKLVPVVADRLAQLRGADGEAAGMVVAGYLSPRTRARLDEVGIGYADATGNRRLALERPPVYIETQGASSDPWTVPGERPLRSLKGPIAGRIVRALCDFWPPFRVEQLVRLSGTSLGSVARTLALLDAEGLIVRKPRGPVTDVTWPDLVRRWAEDYDFLRTNRTRSFLEPRGLSTLLDKLRGVPFGCSVTGSLAASQVAPIAAPRLATIYVAEADRAAAELRLRPAPTGANVILAEPFDRVVFERTWDREGLTYAALSQVVVDLLTGPGRSPAEADELIRWMAEHQDVWRH